MNVKTIFFYENINKKIYVEVFHDYIDKFKIYCRFRKTLYNFKQSLRIWFNIFVTYFNEQNFLILNVDQNMFNNNRVIIVIYVNDLLLVDSNKKFIQKIKKVLHKRFQIININFFVYYLNIKIQRDKHQRTLYFNQKIYLKKIIRNHDMWKCNFMIIFMKINIKFIVVEIDYICFVNDKHRYQSIVDFFMYVMFEIRSNIIYVVSIINRYVFNFNKSH